MTLGYLFQTNVHVFFKLLRQENTHNIYFKMLAFDSSTIMIKLQQTDNIVEMEPLKANILK